MIDFGEKLDELCSTVEVHELFPEYTFFLSCSIIVYFFRLDHNFNDIKYIVLLSVGYSWLWGNIFSSMQWPEQP